MDLREPFGEVVVPNGKLESGQLEIQVIGPRPEKTRCGKDILLIRRNAIGWVNYRLSTASLAEGGKSLLHLIKLECHGPQCERLECNRGCCESASPSCRKELDNSDMFMLNVELPAPINFFCKNV